MKELLKVVQLVRRAVVIDPLALHFDLPYRQLRNKRKVA